jgi:hypothetical protein
MHGPINVKSPNNTSTWQMGFNSAFKGLKSDIKYPGNKGGSSGKHLFGSGGFQDSVGTVGST